MYRRYALESLRESAAQPAPLQEREFSPDERRAAAAKGAALDDGSYPILTVQDLRNAIQAYGRASNKEAVKRHIIRRARALGATDLLPDGWTEAGSPAPSLTTLSEAAALTALVEVEGQPTGAVWAVTVIKAGDSLNGRHYPASTLEAAVPLFEGAKVFADHPSRDEERSRPERSVRDVIGWLQEATWHAADQAIRAQLHLSEAAGALRQLLVDAWRGNRADLLGLSINAEGQIEESVQGGKRRRLVASISAVRSVDLVTVAAAGGRLERLVASGRPDDRAPATDTDDPAPSGAEKDTAMTISLDDLKGLFASGFAEMRAGLLAELKPATPEPTEEAADSQTAPQPRTPDGKFAPKAEGVTEAQAGTESGAALVAVRTQMTALQEAQQRFERQLFEARLETTLAAEGKLPDRVKARIRKLFEARTGTVEDITATIREEREYLAAIQPVQMRQFGAVPTYQGDGASITQDEGDKFLHRLYGLFENADQGGVPQFQSLREAYFHFLRLRGEDEAGFFAVNPVGIFEAMRPHSKGDRDRGRHLYEARVSRGLTLQDAIHTRLRESLVTADWGQVFADVLYNRLVNAYNTDAMYNEWRLLVSDLLSVPDFRTQHITRVGGFADLSSVAEQGTYPNLTSPTDEEVTFAITKYGGMHDITLEDIVNDNIGAIRRIPLALARAAKRTRRNDILNLVTTTNPTMAYDSVALYDAAHGNTGTTALSVSGLSAVTRSMRDQTAYNESALLLGELNKPKILIVPNELEQLAARITGGTSQNYTYAISSNPDTDGSVDPLYFHGKGIQTIVYDEMTDATNWFAVADPSVVPTLAVAHLNGNDVPELLVQDNPTVGSVFTADRYTTRVRLIWGRVVVDHRSYYRQVVAG